MTKLCGANETQHSLRPNERLVRAAFHQRYSFYQKLFPYISLPCIYRTSLNNNKNLQINEPYGLQHLLSPTTALPFQPVTSHTRTFTFLASSFLMDGKLTDSTP